MKCSKKLFYTAYLTFVFSIVLLLFTTQKGDETLWLNAHRNLFLDKIFIGFSFLGEYIVVVCLGLFLLVKNRKMFSLALIIYLIQTFIVQGLKKWTALPRPLAYFKTQHLVPIANSKIVLAGSMPSGHTATVFFISTFLVGFFDINKWISLFLVMITIGVAVSRIYLLAHFKEDVLVGSFIGILMAEITLLIYKKFA